MDDSDDIADAGLPFLYLDPSRPDHLATIASNNYLIYRYDMTPFRGHK
jgi:hypothetical protein